MAGEFEFLEWVRAQQRPSPLVALPAGDDLAVLNWPGDDLLLVGVDQVLDGVHFDSKIHAPRLIGRKVMNRNLSDCAAMACLPVAAVTTAALPGGLGLDYAKELYHGLRDAADPFDCAIIGGDTASWGANAHGKLVLTVTILGRSAGIKPITRAGARLGDSLYVTGPLGGSILGRHLTFTPRIREARALASVGCVSSMIDLSDGLSRDLGHICRQSGVGAVVIAEQVPIHDDVRRLSADRMSALEHALHDGEDHELLFTAGQRPPLPAGIDCHHIGFVTEAPGIFLQSGGKQSPLVPRGWEHLL
jgi:thiamine-monophosphate kinase